MQVIVRRLKVRWMHDCLSDRPVMLDRIEHPCCGLRSSSWYRADRAMLNLAVPSQ